MSEFRNKLIRVNRRITAMKEYDPSAALPADADSADAIEQMLLAEVHLRTAIDMMAELSKKYQLDEYSDTEEDRLKKASYSMLRSSIDLLEDLIYDNFELIVDNIANSEDGEPESNLGLLEEYEITGKFPERF